MERGLPLHETFWMFMFGSVATNSLGNFMKLNIDDKSEIKFFRDPF